MKAIRTLDKIINTFLKIVVVLMLGTMSVVVFAQVVFRIVHMSIPWSEELSKYLLIWCTFLGAALCVRKGSLVGLEFLGNLLPETARKVLKTLVNIAVCVLLVALIGVGFWASRRVWFQTTPVLKQPMGLMYAAIPVGSCFMLLNEIFTTIYLWKGEEEES